MATYVVPQVLVYQDLALAAQATPRRQLAHIAGGHGYLTRYSESTEKSLGYLGRYDYLADTCYSWPNKPVGATIDEAYTQLTIENALLQYFTDAVGSGSTISTVSGYSNRIRSATLAFKANGTTYPRSTAQFFDRDVKVGDVAKVRATVGMTTYTLWTYVNGFAADVVAAVVGAAAGDSNNETTQGLSSSFLKTGGEDNCIDIFSVNAASYDGLAAGDTDEVYTIEVIEGSAGGNATTARLRVTSASGNDDQASVTPAAFGAATAIGTRGLTVTWNDNVGTCSLTASSAGLPIEDFIAGQTWEVTVHQAFTAPVATSGGTYSGTSDTTYIVEVTLGGTYAGAVKPQITVSTTTGIDISGPTNVTAAASSVAVGTKGVTVQFSGTALRKGDRYTIAATAAKEGYMRTLILGHSLNSAVPAATEVELTLFIKSTIDVTENRTGFAPLTNWSQSNTEFCTVAGIQVYESSWTNGGTPMALPIVSDATQTSYSQMYLTYRAWRSELCGVVNGAGNTSDLDTLISGPLHPDNPLKWGVSKALANSNGSTVKFTAVCDPNNVDEWTEVVDLLDGRDDVYGLVPLTTNQTVLDAYVAHVNNQSTADYGRWRVVWVNLAVDQDTVIVDATKTTDTTVALATVVDDPNTSGTQYTLVSVPAGNAKFITNNVRAGDVLRAQYSTDGFGGVTYNEYVVDSIISEDQLLLAAGPAAPINTPAKIEVWRTRTAAEYATAIGAEAGAYSNRRVMAVWPDEVTSGGYVTSGTFLCAALAGLASGVAPHQGLTNVELSGFDSLPRTTQLFNRTNLNDMAGSGVWIVTQDPTAGDVFTRHAVTTADYDTINEREEMVTRNLDSISFVFLDQFSPYIGVANVTPSMIDIIEAETKAAIQLLRGANYTPRLGGQLIDGSIADLRPHATLRDRILLALDLQLPYSLNSLELHLLVG